MGAVSGTIDTAALSRLARGEDAMCLATLVDSGESIYLQLGPYRTDTGDGSPSWGETVIASSADGAIRVVEWSKHLCEKSVVIENT